MAGYDAATIEADRQAQGSVRIMPQITPRSRYTAKEPDRARHHMARRSPERELAMVGR